MRQRIIILAATVALLAAGALQAQAQTDNPELERLFKEDQADREAGPSADIDWQAVSKRDAERRLRVREIVDKGGATTSMDYYHAAMVGTWKKHDALLIPKDRIASVRKLGEL